MKHSQGNPDSVAYQRILKTAKDLFYRNGYRATGINEIIKKSGVAKATFYAHFPSKESLALAYVKAMNQQESQEFTDGIAKYKGPYEKLLGLLKYAITWSENNDHRGCTYIIMSSELTDHEHPVREEGMSHYNSFRINAGRLIRELKEERGAAWKNKDPEKVADDYFLIFTGALALVQVYHNKKPLLDAIESAKRLLS